MHVIWIAWLYEMDGFSVGNYRLSSSDEFFSKFHRKSLRGRPCVGCFVSVTLTSAVNVGNMKRYLRDSSVMSLFDIQKNANNDVSNFSCFEAVAKIMKFRQLDLENKDQGRERQVRRRFDVSCGLPNAR